MESAVLNMVGHDAIKELDEARRANLKPFDVYKFAAPTGHQKSESNIKAYNDHLRTMLPPWLTVYFQTENRKDEGEESHVKRVVKFDVQKYAMDLIARTRVESFPSLLEGAIYLPETGTWRTFTKGENRRVIESRTTKECLQWGLYNEGQVTAVQRFIGRITFNEKYGKHSPFDENPHPELVAFKNGTYNILTNTMQESSPDNYMMNAHDYDVDPEVNEAPRTEELLTAMVGDAAIVLQEFIGYMFYRSHVPFQEFLWLKGTGGNAKSALTRRITALLGRDNVSSIKPAALADPARRFESANLYGKEANIVADVGEDYIKGTDILKALTGGDSISAEFKGIQNFSFTNYAKMMFAANAMPAFSDKSEGFADRVMVIEMINGNVRHTDWWKQFDEEAIEREQPAWAMHCMQLFATALKRHSFTQVQSVIDASQQWLDDNDHFKEFISQFAEIIPNETRGAVVTNVVAEYKAFCEQNGYSDKTSSKTITNRLSEWGITPRKTTQGFDDDDHTGNLNRYPGLHLTGSLLNPRYNK